MAGFAGDAELDGEALHHFCPIGSVETGSLKGLLGTQRELLKRTFATIITARNNDTTPSHVYPSATQLENHYHC